MSATRYAAASLVAFARTLLEHAGLSAEIATDVADILVMGDLMGHTTHGLALLAPYLAEIENGSMAKAGAPTVINAMSAVQTWDGARLPGPWLTLRALQAAETMARNTGTGTVVIRRSHHIACLAAYLPRATERGLIAIIQSSDPTVAAVAPHGGVTPIMTPNPIAAGLPTSGDPILIDISTSITSMGYTLQCKRAGEKLPGPWLIDVDGNATDDPDVLWQEPKGALLPLGGLDTGYKGFGLGLIVEALTAGLAGFGRADRVEGWGASVFVQVLDPEAFGGLRAFRRQMDFMIERAHDATPRASVDRVRIPGERAMQRYREQRTLGVALVPGIMSALEPWAQKLATPSPTACA